MLFPCPVLSIVGSTMLVGGQAIAAKLEVVVDPAVGRQEALGMAG